MPSQTRRGRGRPPAGPAGQKVSSFPQLTVRLPAETRAKLSTLSLLLATPMWRIIDQAIDVYVKNLPADDRKILDPLVERLSRGDWPTTTHWAVAWEKPPESAGVTPRKPRTRRVPDRMK